MEEGYLSFFEEDLVFYPVVFENVLHDVADVLTKFSIDFSARDDFTGRGSELRDFYEEVLEDLLSVSELIIVIEEVFECSNYLLGTHRLIGNSNKKIKFKTKKP